MIGSLAKYVLKWVRVLLSPCKEVWLLWLEEVVSSVYAAKQATKHTTGTVLCRCLRWRWLIPANTSVTGVPAASTSSITSVCRVSIPPVATAASVASVCCIVPRLRLSPGVVVGRTCLAPAVRTRYLRALCLMLSTA